MIKVNGEGSGERTIVLTGGGTAGHVMPHIALLPELRKTFGRICYIGSFEGIERRLMQAFSFVEFFSVTTVKLRRSFDLANLLIPFKLARGVREARRILKKISPDAVFSKGGFVALPVVQAAAGLKIPVIAHESDMSMGLANRLSARNCKVICTTFAETAQRKSYKKTLGGETIERENSKGKNKCVHTGAAIRRDIYEGDAGKIEERHFSGRGGFGGSGRRGAESKGSEGKKKLLVIGGSSGAARINNAVRAAIGELLKEFRIIHIAGKGKIDARFEGLEADGYVQAEFVEDINNYFAWADVVVSRAGSNALCELLCIGKRVLFIPLSKAQSRGDQIENALWVLKERLGEVLWEEDLTSEHFVGKIRGIFSADIRKVSAGELDGTDKIAEQIKAFVCE